MRGHRGPEPGTSKRLFQPLSPSLLYEIGITDGSLQKKSDEYIYRIWGYKDHTVFQNKNMGHIHIIRKPSGYSVERILVHADALQHITNAEVCLSDDDNSVKSWVVENKFTDTAGCIRDELTLKRSFELKDNVIKEVENGAKTIISGDLILDWSMLLNASNLKTPCTYDYMDMMMMHKPYQNIVNNGEYTYMGNKLKIISQFGFGMASRDFYTDDDGVVQFMLQDQIAWIPDVNAKQATYQLVEDLTTKGVHYEY